MHKHVVSLGDLVLDVIMPIALPVQAAQHQEVPWRALEPGGAGNFMIAARHMGLAVTATGAVGDDPIGQMILDGLRAEGIDVRHVLTQPDATSTLVITLTDQTSGQHVFIGNTGHGPDLPYPPGLDALWPQVGAVFLQGYSLFEARIRATNLRALERATAARVPIFADTGPYMAYVAPEDIRWLIQHAQVLLMTEDEIPLLAGGRSGAAAIDYLLAAQPAAIVIKRGPHGCVVITPDGANAEIPGLRVPVVDTVGAGDCFDAAFIAGYLHGLSWVECGQLANAMGAAAVGRVGAGRNAPACADVMNLLNGAGIAIEYPC